MVKGNIDVMTGFWKGQMFSREGFVFFQVLRKDKVQSLLVDLDRLATADAKEPKGHPFL